MLCYLYKRFVNGIVCAGAYNAEVRVMIDIDKDNIDFVNGHISREISTGPSRGVN